MTLALQLDYFFDDNLYFYIENLSNPKFTMIGTTLQIKLFAKS